MCAAKSDVRFTPNSDRKSGFPHKVMSTLSPEADSKADIRIATSHVRFTPESGHVWCS
jgi:hypothetical protein